MVVQKFLGPTAPTKDLDFYTGLAFTDCGGQRCPRWREQHFTKVHLDPQTFSTYPCKIDMPPKMLGNSHVDCFQKPNKEDW